MNISVSNIIWSKGRQRLPDFLDQLVRRGIRGVEMALSCIWNEPVSVPPSELRWLRNELEARSIELVSLHSLTFTRPDLEIFNSPQQRAALVAYLKKYCDIANALNCENVVFGSPKSRATHNKSKEELDSIFLDFISELDFVIQRVNFNVEPLSTIFCEYLNDFRECVALLDQRQFQQIYIQLDARSVIESGESIQGIFRNASYIRHAHAGNPGLTMPGPPYQDVHTSIKHSLIDVGYQGFVSAEVIAQSRASESEHLDKVIDSMVELYGK